MSRSDVQFLTLNMDENPGLLEPFLKEHQLNLIVLPAYSYVRDTLEVSGIPQNWIVDPKGTWRWSQIGYGGGTDADFQEEMLQKLDSTKNP